MGGTKPSLHQPHLPLRKETPKPLTKYPPKKPIPSFVQLLVWFLFHFFHVCVYVYVCGFCGFFCKLPQRFPTGNSNEGMAR